MGSNLLRVTIVAALGLSYQAQAYDCIGLEVWDSNTVYTSGDLVQTSNHAYQASHWTQGNDPVRNSGDWQTWQDLGQCNTGSGNTAPAVSIVSPVNNAEIPEGTATTIQASASDTDGSIAHVISWLMVRTSRRSRKHLIKQIGQRSQVQPPFPLLPLTMKAQHQKRRLQSASP